MRTYRVRAAALCLVVAALTAVYISACATRQEGAVRPKEVHAVALPPHKPPPPEDVEPSPTPSPSPTATQPKNPPAPKSTVVSVPTYNGPPATNPTDAVAHAASVGVARGVRVGVAIKDRQTGVVYGAGDYNGSFASASVVKAFIATSLLVSGKANDPNTRSMMYEMIVASNDNDASALYGPAGGSGLTAFISSRYGISGLAPPPANLAGYWGETKITAHAMVEFYDAVVQDPLVAGWLMDAMGHARATAADGTKQLFGLPAVATSWRVKQGWMCCLDSKTRMLSTGYLDHDRFTAALMIEGGTSIYLNSGATTLTGMAKALMPNGSIPLGAPPAQTTPPQASPSPSPSPAPQAIGDPVAVVREDI
jgi:hypothetical protein